MKRFKVFNEKKVLLTGHSGFKGGWLASWLMSLGAKVYGISFEDPSSPCFNKVVNLNDRMETYQLDIRHANEFSKIFFDVKPDFVFHLAAQALVRESYANPIDTIATNLMGTVSVLDAIRSADWEMSCVFITSDKSYCNKEWYWGYREHDELGGSDPYSASKAMAELAIKSYFDSYISKMPNVFLGVARAGNVIGGGDWAHDRIVPDAVFSLEQRKLLEVRSPKATRPWQHVLEPISGYLNLASMLSSRADLNGEAFNFGPTSEQNRTVADLLNQMKVFWPQIDWIDISKDHTFDHEAGLLKLNCDKASHLLTWRPALSFEQTVKMTVDWYRLFYEGDKAELSKFVQIQIGEYIEVAKKQNIEWALG